MSNSDGIELSVLWPLQKEERSLPGVVSSHCGKIDASMLNLDVFHRRKIDTVTGFWFVCSFVHSEGKRKFPRF